MKILTMTQASGEWFAARCGVVSASEADSIFTPEFKLKTGEAPRNYMFKKLAEKKMNYSDDMLDMGAASWAADQGQILEKIALPWYEFAYNTTVRRVGFCKSDDGRIGCSPDGLTDGYGLEIKSPQPKNHLKYLVDGVLPKEYVVQCHWSLHVTGLPLWKFISFNRQLPKLVLDVPRDEAIQQKIKDGLAQFFASFDAALQRIQQLEEKQ